MTDSLHDSLSRSLNQAVNDSGTSVERLTLSRAPAEQGAGSREQRSRDHTSSRTEPQTLRRDDRSDERESITSQVRRIPEAAALARLVCGIRPEWSIDEVYAWALRDERPWADVVAAGINGARDRAIRQVGGLQFAGPAATTVPQTYPTVHEALNPQLCEHDFRTGACPLCRRGAA